MLDAMGLAMRPKLTIYSYLSIALCRLKFFFIAKLKSSLPLNSYFQLENLSNPVEDCGDQSQCEQIRLNEEERNP